MIVDGKTIVLYKQFIGFMQHNRYLNIVFLLNFQCAPNWPIGLAMRYFCEPSCSYSNWHFQYLRWWTLQIPRRGTKLASTFNRHNHNLDNRWQHSSHHGSKLGKETTQCHQLLLNVPSNCWYASGTTCHATVSACNPLW